MKFLLLLLTLVSSLAYGQRSQTIDADCLKIKDGTCIDKLELGYLDGTTSLIQTQLGGKVSTSGNETITGVKTFSGKTVASSTTNGFAPCPTMTEVQRNAVSLPSSGDCVYNSTTLTLNVYNGTTWKSAGGGVNKWATSTSYQVDDVIIESSKFYICLIAHTSGTFATDLAATRWLIISNNVSDASGVLPIINGGTNSSTALSGSSIAISNGTAIVQGAAGTTTTLLHGNASGAPTYSAASLTTDVSGVLPMANGGTNKNATANNGAIAYTDADSFELLAPGTSGQILQTNGAGAPSFVNKSVSAKAQNAASVSSEEIQVPNNQLTQTATGQHLIETGNTNILVNPSFGHSTLLSGWTESGTGTDSIESTVVVHGLRSLRAVTSAQTINVSQSSTLYAAQFADGVQGLLMVRIKTNHTGAIDVCSINAGVVSTTNCVRVNADNKWGLYKVPFILGATSNGISIVGASGTGTTYIDDAFVGAVDLKTDVDQSRIAGESYFAGTASCEWSRTSTTIGPLTASATCPGPTIVRSSMGAWATTDANLPRQTITNLPAGTYKATFLIETSVGTAASTALAINDGTTTCEAVNGNNSNVYAAGQVVSCTFSYTASGDRTFELYVASSAGTLAVVGSRVTPRISPKFILEYFGSGQIYSASCGANCVDNFSFDASTTGVVTADDLDFVNGNASSIANTSEYTYTFNSGKLTATPSCEVTAVSNGAVEINAQIMTVSSSAITVRLARTSDEVNTVSAHTISCDKTGADFIASRTIVGSFAEVMTTPNVSKPVFFSYTFGTTSTTACSASPCAYLDQIGNYVSSVTRASIAEYTANLSKTFTKLKCTYTQQAAAAAGVILGGSCNNCSSVSFSARSTVPATQDVLGNVLCHGFE